MPTPDPEARRRDTLLDTAMQQIAARAKLPIRGDRDRRDSTSDRGELASGLTEGIPEERGRPFSLDGKSGGSQNDLQRRVEPDSGADVAIVVALPRPELEQVLKVFGGVWAKEGRDGVVFNVATCEFGDRQATVAVASQTDMGLVSSTILASKAVRAWTPQLLMMLGICAGRRGKVELGDVIVAKQLFDYGSGKISDGRLHPDYQPIPLDDELCNYLTDFSTDGPALERIRESWPLATGRPNTVLRAHVGPMASGAAVVADEKIVEGITDHMRSLVAIDMEAYGVAKAAQAALGGPRALVIKGVQDFADAEKGDDIREYAAYVSASFAREFLVRTWSSLF